LLDDAFEGMVRSFDINNGGFGGAPKFPQPLSIEFLLRYHHRTKDTRAASMVRTTLDRMAAGGIYDQLGGGFARYAVDAHWLVPHFEKMLYDNALLANCYIDAFRAFGDRTYHRVASEILDFAIGEMLTAQGGFASALDADSEGEEGRFYVWSPDEIEALLPPQAAALLMRAFGVREGGNFEGKTILNVAMPLEEVAAEQRLSLPEARQILDEARATLLAARESRVRPGRDDKVLTSWNGLMLRALAEGSRVLDRPDFGKAAERLAGFLLSTLLQKGRLLRSYKDGQARLNAYLEDYAFLADGLIALYQSTFERRWLDAAIDITQTMLEEFAAESGPLLFDTGTSHERLISRPRDLQDGAIPAGNSVAASVLLKLAAVTGESSLARQASDMLRTMARPMTEHPTSFGRMLSALDSFLATPRELALVGHIDDPGVAALAAIAWNRYEPHLVLGFADPANPATNADLPILANKPIKDGLATAYLCERHACLPPVTDPIALAKQLDRGTGIRWTEF
ncbi:MAG: thioredoxin domain-containing protein, partial [Chloroflexota bacterium]|nr:thioredoxin domain-containing protein [Chloroflexota bacterium]